MVFEGLVLKVKVMESELLGTVKAGMAKTRAPEIAHGVWGGEAQLSPR